MTHRADRIVAEVNNGGDMVGAALRMVDRNAAFTAVRASRGKVVRAEPVAALYEQGRIHHIGTFPQSKIRRQILHRISTAPRRGIRRTALMLWYGRSANCWSSRWGFAPKVRFSPDSLLEGTGFEPPVLLGWATVRDRSPRPRGGGAAPRPCRWYSMSSSGRSFP
ncbi:MAG TPA: hypothetical protein VGF39_01170 [Stellaceae bacterium]